MKSTQQKMEACMDKDIITLSNTHTHPRQSPSSSQLFHPPTHTHTNQLPPQTPNHAIMGKESHRNQHNLFSSYHTKRKKIKSHSNPSQHTALHSQAITGTLERGWLREGGEGCVCGGQTFSVKHPPTSSGLVLYSGHLLILCWYTGQLAANSNHGRRLDRRMAVIIVSINIKVLVYHEVSTGIC